VLDRALPLASDFVADAIGLACHAAGVTHGPVPPAFGTARRDGQQGDTSRVPLWFVGLVAMLVAVVTFGLLCVRFWKGCVPGLVVTEFVLVLRPRVADDNNPAE
jgi:hypothetical protein